MARQGHRSGGLRHEPLLLDFINSPAESVRKRLLKEIGAPSTCPRVDIDESEQWNVEELVLIPSVENRTEQSQNPITRKAYNVGAFATPINTTVRVVGVNETDPKNRRAILQTWECEQTKTDIDKFEMTPMMMAALKQFQTREGEEPLERMREIARDLATNVTRIYGREEMHLAYDVVWHSVLNFNFLGKPVGKGWIELLVVGDTRTGKSEAALQLSDHYQAGVMSEANDKHDGPRNPLGTGRRFYAGHGDATPFVVSAPASPSSPGTKGVSDG